MIVSSWGSTLHGGHLGPSPVPHAIWIALLLTPFTSPLYP